MAVGEVSTRVFPILITTSYFLTVFWYRAPLLECCGTVGSVNGGAPHGDFLSPRSSQEGPRVQDGQSPQADYSLICLP